MKKFTIEEFIKHVSENKERYTCYCEILIDKDGNIIEAIPSHQLALVQMYGIPEHKLYDLDCAEKDNLYNRIPNNASPVHWMCEDLNCCVVWYNIIIIPNNCSPNQINTIVNLINRNIIYRNPEINISVEKTHCDLINNELFFEIDSLFNSKRAKEEEVKRIINRKINK